MREEVRLEESKPAAISCGDTLALEGRRSRGRRIRGVTTKAITPPSAIRRRAFWRKRRYSSSESVWMGAGEVPGREA